MANTGGPVSSVTVVKQHLARALAAPLGVLLVIPLLVVVVGLVVGLGARSTLHQTVRELTAEHYADLSAAAEARTVACLGQVETLFAVQRGLIRQHGADLSLEDWTAYLALQLHHRPGVAYLGFGTTDGRFLGVFLSPDGVHATERVVRQDGSTLSRTYAVTDGRLALIAEDPDSGFDPRLRPWYSGAMEKDARHWTAPYLWYASGRPGFSCSEPVHAADGRALGVLSVDFDFEVFSEFISHNRPHGARSYIYTDRREVVAYPDLSWTALQQRLDEPGVPMLWHLQDTAVDALQERLGGSRPEDGRMAFYRVGDNRHLAVLNRLHMPGGVEWTVVTAGALTELLAPVQALARDSVVISMGAVLVALVLAVLFAVNLVRTHRRADSAEHQAQRARDQVQRFGAYRLLRRLGVGGMGEVWVGEHSLLARPVAVKLIKDAGHADPEEQQRSLERFRREARALARLNSRNTIEIYDFGVTAENECFYVMELLDGMDLHDLVDNYGVQPLSRVLSILEQAALSLAEAHAQGLVHRDIKPANITLCRIAEELDVVKVLDFGMVRAFGAAREQRLTIQGTVEGTPEFMSPEQAQDLEEVDGRADLYALACVAYFLLSGRPPFECDSTMATLMAHVQDQQPLLDTLVDTPLPPDLVELLYRCLNKAPGQRPADMQAFIQALRHIRAQVASDWSPEQQAAWWQRVAPPRVETDSVVVRSLHRRVDSGS